MHPLTTKSQSILLIQLVLKKKAKTIVLLKCKKKKKPQTSLNAIHLELVTSKQNRTKQKL